MTSPTTGARGAHPPESDISLAAWLATRSDDDLAALLRVRRDLLLPPPATTAVLAVRALLAASVTRAANERDAMSLAVWETVAALGGATEPVKQTAVTAALKKRATAAEVTAALTELRTAALVWGQRFLSTSPAAAAMFSRTPTLISDDSPVTADQVDAARRALETISDAERAIVETLARGTPTGRTRDAAPGTPGDRPIQQLLTAGLLTYVDDATVELPRYIGQLVRGERPTTKAGLHRPEMEAVTVAAAEINATAAGAALDLIRQSEIILDALAQAPAPVLRTHGLGVRDLKRLAKAVGVTENRAGLLVEILTAAGLLTHGLPDTGEFGGMLNESTDYWAPTTASDAWREGSRDAAWYTLAHAWLTMPREPSLIGLRTSDDRPIAALSAEARNPASPAERVRILSILGEYGPGQAIPPADLATVISWLRPRMVRTIPYGYLMTILDEAAAVGVLGRGAISDPGRELLSQFSNDRHDPHAVQILMHDALPHPLDYVLAQADLTIVAPGPLVPALRQELALAAEIESSGAATVYRVTENSVRHALDAGRTAADLHRLFTTSSKTPVPQALTYLIDDVSRRHGQLRAGIATSFIRCEDPALLAEVLRSSVAGDLALRALAPTVLISQAPLAEVLSRLRGAGFAPAGEDSTGSVIDLQQRGARLSPRPVRPAASPAAVREDVLARALVAMRAGDRAEHATETGTIRTDGTRATGSAALALLQLAVHTQRSVSIGYVDAAGVGTHRIVEPVSVSSGQLDAIDPSEDGIRHFALHRITSVAFAGE